MKTNKNKNKKNSKSSKASSAKTRKSPKKVGKTGVKISAEEMAEIRHDAESIVNRANIKKYEFPLEEVTKMLVRLYRANGSRFNVKNSYKFAAGYSNVGDDNYREVNAIISLASRHHPEETVVASSGKGGKKVLIVGETAKEMLSKSAISWDEAHISTAGAKIPLSLPVKRKLKCFGGDTISSEIIRQESKSVKNKSKNKVNRKVNRKAK